MAIIMLCNDIDEIHNDTSGSDLLDCNSVYPRWRLRYIVVDHTRPARAIRIRDLDHLCIPIIFPPAPQPVLRQAPLLYSAMYRLIGVVLPLSTSWYLVGTARIACVSSITWP